MSINQYSSDIPKALWWTQQQQAILMKPIQNPSTSGPLVIHPPWPSQLYHPHNHQTNRFNSHTPRDAPTSSVYPTTPRFNLNQDNNKEDDNNEDQNSSHVENPISRSPIKGGSDEKEPMFEKPLTPSDVGKLNRLVIPKQHAEKYFPLGTDLGESKGLILSFEDESGKCWRFRYSYWNSSQSYVLTKGWSRYVKEKRLNAGDVVVFERHRTDTQRLFINWRRPHHQQQSSGSTSAHVSRAVVASAGCGSNGNSNSNDNGVGGVGMGVGWTRGFYSMYPYPTHQPLPYQPDCLHPGRGSQSQNQTTSPVLGNSSRVLRLFGVNMECQPELESGPSRPECSYMSSTQGTATHQFYYHHQPSYSNPNPHTHHMDVNQMKNRRG